MESPAIDALLRRVAAFGLDDLLAITIDVDDEQWHRFLQLVGAHRLSGLLNEAVGSGAPALDSGRRAEADEMHRRMTARGLLLETMLVSVAGLLDAEDVPLRVLKGPASAAFYPDPAWRPYVDIDLLVPGERWADAARILDGAGYRRRNAGLGEAFDRRFGKGATFRHEMTGVNVDLHRTLVAGPYGFLIDPADMFAGSTTVDVGHVSLPALDRETQFIHTCISAVLSDARPKLITVRDVAQQLRASELDPHRVGDLCERWRIGGVVSAAVAATNEALGAGDHGVRLSVSARAPHTERVARWAYSSESKRWRRQTVTAAVFVPGWKNRAAYLRTVMRARGPDAG